MAEKIEIDSAELKAIVEQNKTLVKLLQQQGAGTEQTTEGGRIKTRRATSQRNATILFVDGKPVVGLENIGSGGNTVNLYEVTDPRDPKKVFLCANIIVRDLKSGKDEIIPKVNFMELIQQGERRDLPIKKMKKEDWVVEHGSTAKQEIRGDKYHMEDLGVDVPLEVQGSDFYYTFEVDGVEFEVFHEFINMAKSTPRPEKEVINTTDI